MTLFEKSTSLYLVSIDDVIDPNLHNNINDCFKEAYNDLVKIRDDLASQGKDTTNLTRLIEEYHSMLGNLRYVSIRSYVYAKDVNLWIDLCKKLLEIDKEIVSLL